MRARLKALVEFLRQRGGMLGCDDFANVVSLTMMGVPPEAAVERALDVSYPDRLTRKKKKRE